jgi:hypothetical protein
MTNFAKNKLSAFRLWINSMWYDHIAELESFNLPVSYNSQEYFRRYKYWLKREYQYQRKIKHGT